MAMPTMGPEKEVPLWTEVKGQSLKPLSECRRSRSNLDSTKSQQLNLGSLRHQLGTVMGQSRQQVCLAPVEEVV